MENLKVKLPEELQSIMNLNNDEWQTLGIDILDHVMNSVNFMQQQGINDISSLTAWRTKKDDTGKFFQIKHRIVIDEKQDIRYELTAFKPMDKNEYRTWCFEEFGGDPFVNYNLN